MALLTITDKKSRVWLHPFTLIRMVKARPGLDVSWPPSFFSMNPNSETDPESGLSKAERFNLGLALAERHAWPGAPMAIETSPLSVVVTDLRL